MAAHTKARNRTAEALQVESSIVEVRWRVPGLPASVLCHLTCNRVRCQLGHMFSNLTNMVAEQAEVAREIEENMNLACVTQGCWAVRPHPHTQDASLTIVWFAHREGYVQQGQTELLKWLQDVSRHRSLILKTFAILVVFILLFAFMNRG